MARPDSWMPFYWGDFWRDTGHLTASEGWAYINLIGAYWIKGGPLEADEERLQRLAKVVSLSEWERVRKTVLAFFDLTVTETVTVYSHRRIDRELAAATKAYNSRCAHMAKVNAKRRKQQSPSTVTATNTATVTAPQSTVTVTQPQPQSPKGDIQATPGADAPLKARIFGPCLEWLGKTTKQDPNKLRALVGKWCSKHGDGKTLEAISAAQTHAALDPIPYITRVLTGGGVRGGKPPGTDWDGAVAAAQGAEPMAGDVRSAWDGGRTIDGEWSAAAGPGAGQPGPVPAGGTGSGGLDERLRNPDRGARRGADVVPQDAGTPAGRSAGAGGGADHHDLEMGVKAPVAGGHPRHGEAGNGHANAAVQPGPRGAGKGAAGADALDIPPFLDVRPGAEKRRTEARAQILARTG